MTNLLHLVVELVDDDEARQRFVDDPSAALSDLDGLTGEDVAAVADVARLQVDPDRVDALTEAMTLHARDGESARDVAVRALLDVCAAVDQALERPDE